MQREIYTAFHEAGHIVIGHVLGLTIRSSTIVPDAGGYGCVSIKSPLATLDEWDDRGRWHNKGHDVRSVYRAHIMESMGGREAAELCCGPGGDFIGDGNDIWQIENLIHLTYNLDCSYHYGIDGNPSSDFKLKRLREATRHLCIRHREQIEHIAQALINRRRLSREEIESLMRMT